MTLQEAREEVQAFGWLWEDEGEEGIAELDWDHLVEAQRKVLESCPNSETAAEGLALLNAAENPEVLVALWEALPLAADMTETDWQKFIDTLPDLECGEIARMMEYALAYSERIVTVRDALAEKLKGGNGDGV